MAKTDFAAPINPKTADLPIEAMNDLRNPHFHYGFDKSSYETTSRSEHHGQGHRQWDGRN